MENMVNDTEQKGLSSAWKQAIAMAAATIMCGACVLIIGTSQFASDRIEAFLNAQVQSTTIALQSKQVFVLEEMATRQADAFGAANPVEATALADVLSPLVATEAYLSESIAGISEGTPRSSPELVPATVFSKTTPTPQFPTLGVSQEISVGETSSQSVFEGSVYISITEASDYDNEVTAIVYTPGFPQARIEAMNAGFKFVYESTGRFEVLILGFGSGFSDSARLRITYLGPIGEEPRIDRSSEMTGINEADSGTFFDGDLVISVLEASSYDDAVSLVVSSPGAQGVALQDLGVGDVFRYEGNSSYEVLVSGFGSGFRDSVEFVVSRLR